MARFRSKWSPAAGLTAALSVVIAVALAAVSVVAADDHEQLVLASAVAGAVVLGAGLVVASNAGVWLGLALVATAGAAADAPQAPLFAIGLFLLAEAGISSIEERFERHQERGVYNGRLLLLGGVMAASLIVGGVMRLLARTDGDRGSQYTLIAAVGIVLLVGLVVGRARPVVRTTSQPNQHD